jgi:hypothetical protein
VGIAISYLQKNLPIRSVEGRTDICLHLPISGPVMV